MKNLLTQIKINYLRVILRNKRFLFMSIILPIVFYLLFTKVMNVGVPAHYMKTWQLNYMISMAVYSSLISSVVTASNTLLEDREKHFTLFVKLTSGSDLRYYLGMIAVFLPLNIFAIAVLGLTAKLANGVSVSVMGGVALVILLPLLSIPLLLIGILISMSGSSNTVNILSQIVMFAFAIIGALWWPIELLPKALQTIGKLLPTYQISTLMQEIIHNNPVSTDRVLGLVIWTVVLALAITLFMRHKRLQEVQTI